MGLLVSMRVLPRKFCGPASWMTSSTARQHGDDQQFPELGGFRKRAGLHARRLRRPRSQAFVLGIARAHKYPIAMLKESSCEVLAYYSRSEHSDFHHQLLRIRGE